MARDERGIASLREHMAWARTYAIYWLVVCLAVFGGAYAIAEVIGLAPELRTPLFIMVGTIIVVNTIWQAAALMMIRLQEVVLPRRLGN
jgi:hypothetical protein